MGELLFDAILRDADGVARHWDPDGMSGLDRAYGLPAGTLAAAFAPERLQPAITGRITDEQWRAAVAADLERRMPVGGTGAGLDRRLERAEGSR